MTCREAERLVMPYINGELTDAELAEFLKHIDTCEDCREELEIYFTVDVGIRHLQHQGGPGDGPGDLTAADSHPLSAADGQVRGEYPVLLGGVGGAHFTAAHLGTAGLFRLIICGPAPHKAERKSRWTNLF